MQGEGDAHVAFRQSDILEGVLLVTDLLQLDFTLPGSSSQSADDGIAEAVRDLHDDVLVHSIGDLHLQRKGNVRQIDIVVRVTVAVVGMISLTCQPDTDVIQEVLLIDDGILGRVIHGRGRCRILVHQVPVYIEDHIRDLFIRAIGISRAVVSGEIGVDEFDAAHFVTERPDGVLHGGHGHTVSQLGSLFFGKYAGLDQVVPQVLQTALAGIRAPVTDVGNIADHRGSLSAVIIRVVNVVNVVRETLFCVRILVGAVSGSDLTQTVGQGEILHMIPAGISLLRFNRASVLQIDTGNIQAPVLEDAMGSVHVQRETIPLVRVYRRFIRKVGRPRRVRMRGAVFAELVGADIQIVVPVGDFRGVLRTGRASYTLTLGKHHDVVIFGSQFLIIHGAKGIVHEMLHAAVRQYTGLAPLRGDRQRLETDGCSVGGCGHGVIVDTVIRRGFFAAGEHR